MAYYDLYIDKITETTGDNKLEVKPNGMLSGITPESSELIEKADVISNTVIENVKFYKERASRDIRNTFELVNNNIEHTKKELNKNNASILSMSIPKIIEDEKLSFDLNLEYMSYADIRLESKNEEEIRELLLVADTKYTDTISDNKLLTVWDKYFVNFGTDNLEIAKAVHKSALTEETMYDVYVIYFILKAMVYKDYIGGTGNLDEYRDNLSKYFNYIKRNIAQRIEMVKKAINSNMLVININKERKQVTIVEDLYTDYISSGGTVDALYGTLFKEGGSNELITEYILGDKENLKNLYLKDSAATLAKSVTELNSFTHKALLAAITNMVNTSGIEGAEKEEMFDTIKTYIDDLPLNRLGNPLEVIEDIYATIIYKGTNLKEFLGLVKMYTETTTLKHGITLAISDMVATFLINGIDVLKDK